MMSRPVTAIDPARLRWGWMGLALSILAVAMVAGITIGPAGLDPGQVIRELAGGGLVGRPSTLSVTHRAILWEIRLPRVVLGGLVGGLLSLAGASYQGVFRNPLADPYLLGVAAGGGLGATAVIALVPSADTRLLPVAAFAGALAAVGLAYAVGRSMGGRSAVSLILAGVAVAAFFTALQTYILQRNSDTIRQVYSWILGHLATTGWREVLILLPYVAVCGTGLVLHRRLLDVMSVGDEETDGLGVSSSRVRTTVGHPRHTGHRGRGGGERPDRLRRYRGAAHDPTAGGGQLPVPHSDLCGRRGRLPDPGRSGRPNGGQSGRASDRCHHLLHRCALLHGRAAYHPELRRMSVAVKDLSVSYRPGHPVLQEVSLRVDTHEWLGLLGPNGAGKSTLLKAIAGLVGHSGSITLDGVDSASLPHRDRARSVAFVPQEPVMPSGMTVTEYVLLGRTPHLPYLGSEGAHDLAVARSALDLLDMRFLVGRNLADLSGGERRRVALARALAQEASNLLLDEPTGALDIGQGQNALELIGYLREERPMTIITAMHDLTLAGQFPDRLLLLAGGRTVAEGTAATVLTADYIREFYRATVEVVRVNGGVAVVPVRVGTG